MALTSISIVLDDGRAFTFSDKDLGKVKDAEVLAALEAAGVAPTKPAKNKVEETKEISN